MDLVLSIIAVLTFAILLLKEWSFLVACFKKVVRFNLSEVHAALKKICHFTIREARRALTLFKKSSERVDVQISLTVVNLYAVDSQLLKKS